MVLPYCASASKCTTQYFDSIDREAGVADANQVNEGQDAEREGADAAEDKAPVSPARSGVSVSSCWSSRRLP